MQVITVAGQPAPYQGQGVLIPDLRWSGQSFLGLLRRNRVAYDIVDHLENNSTLVLFKSSNDYEKACTMWECLTGVRRIGYIPYKQFVN